MSPETKKGHSYDYKADVWSAGCVIYELVSLEKFFNESLIREQFFREKVPCRLIKLMKL